MIPRRPWLSYVRVALLMLAMWLAVGVSAQAPIALPVPTPTPAAGGPSITLNLGDGAESRMATGLQVLALMTLLTLAPALMIMLTSFTRIIIVLGFVRRALSTQEVPPTQVLLGMALFLTFFVMAPTWSKIHQEAIAPYLAGETTMAESYKLAEAPTREFLFRNTRKNDLALFLSISQTPRPATRDEVPTHVLVPAFIISELQTAFLIGFIIYIPFLIIDMVIGSVLLSMGMMMLPPVIVSLPFKIILFVLVDGWNLIIGSLVRSFN